MTARISRIIFSVMFVTVSPFPALAQEDVRGVKLRGEGLKVIEEKCLVCHNRQRIDAAVKERRQMERIMKRMESKGVVLTEKERRVMGHFWGKKMFKESSPQK
jgi:hypothetical protein